MNLLNKGQGALHCNALLGSGIFSTRHIQKFKEIEIQKCKKIERTSD